jgi:pimeloyl-ACP methyl ester carboxylesterase
VRFRYPTILGEAALDVLAALHFLETEGVGGAAVTGHSFGGAVALQAGAHSDTVRTVVALSTQAFGAEAAAHLPPGCATLFIHGTADEVLSPECSRYAYKLAHEPKRLRLYEGAGHGLDEIADELRREVRDWIAERLTGRPPP